MVLEPATSPPVSQWWSARLAGVPNVERGCAGAAWSSGAAAARPAAATPVLRALLRERAGRPSDAAGGAPTVYLTSISSGFEAQALHWAASLAAAGVLNVVVHARASP